jgi:hypothetical protein
MSWVEFFPTHVQEIWLGDSAQPPAGTSSSWGQQEDHKFSGADRLAFWRSDLAFGGDSLQALVTQACARGGMEDVLVQSAYSFVVATVVF